MTQLPKVRVLVKMARSNIDAWRFFDIEWRFEFVVFALSLPISSALIFDKYDGVFFYHKLTFDIIEKIQIF